MLLGIFIIEILCGSGLHKTLPVHKVRSVGVLLSPDEYRETGGQNLKVLLVLRGKDGKCRSHKMWFGVMERWFRVR